MTRQRSNKRIWSGIEEVNLGGRKSYIDRVINQGYEIQYCVPNNGFNDLWIRVKGNESTIRFKLDDMDFAPNCKPMGFCEDIYVEPKHRRKGIGTSVYILAECILVCILHSEGRRSDDANKFGGQKDRPFGMEYYLLHPWF